MEQTFDVVQVPCATAEVEASLAGFSPLTVEHCAVGPRVQTQGIKKGENATFAAVDSAGFAAVDSA
jgi:hypothetical protein